jgi:predicted AAA+ superfamily ATPase
VFIDEVQRIPALLDGVQAIVDAHPRRFRFLLSGSSARKLRRGHANLLSGRIVLYDLHLLLAHGTLPGIYADRDPASRSSTLQSYVDAYLREEIQAEALVRDIGGYSRLLDLAAASSGRVVNLHALSRDAAVSYETGPALSRRPGGHADPLRIRPGVGRIERASSLSVTAIQR